MPGAMTTTSTLRGVLEPLAPRRREVLKALDKVGIDKEHIRALADTLFSPPETVGRP